jgi:superfamily II DNA or RNA helicase
VLGTGSWDESDVSLQAWVETHRKRALEAYVANPLLISEHGMQEDSFRTGGYAQRQVLELVQNAADALRRSGRRGRVEVVLDDDTLYCANEGTPFGQEGLEAVAQAYLSDKRGEDMGRFGLGFKSVLGVTDTPMVLSRSVSFTFSADASRRALEAIAPHARRYPVLRLPMLADARAEMDTDPTLADLGQWAQTVIRLPLAGHNGRLAADMRNFPREFLLFAPFVAKLGIRLPDGSGHEFRCEQVAENRFRLTGGGGWAEWMVWHQAHRPSEDALAVVSEAIRRPEVVVSYAAPLDDTQKIGRFWAYFPLQDTTSTRGILNAPWHISDDRTNLLPGEFNQELLQVAADLVVNALPMLSTPQDPARHFDYMPARGRESDNFGDDRLTELVPDAAATTACVPDAEGVLRLLTDLDYPNTDLHTRLESATFKAWSEAPGRPVRSPHPSCYTTATRRARLRRLVRSDVTKPAPNELDAAKWLERVVPDATDEQCRAALAIVLSVGDANVRRDMGRAAVVPDTAGTLTRLDLTEHLFLRGDRLSTTAGIRLVRPSFLEQAEVEEHLRSLGFNDVDPRHELRQLSITATNRWTDEQWRGFWDLVSEVSLKDAKAMLLEHVAKQATLKVLCRDGSWQHVGYAVVPGVVHPTDASIAVDVEYHELHLTLLEGIGVAARPVITTAAAQDPTQLEYRRLLRARHTEDLKPRDRPERHEIDFREREGLAPLHVLRRFAESHDDRARASWTRELLTSQTSSTWALEHHNAKKFPPREVVAPHIWAAQTYGLLDTGWGPREARQCLHPNLARLDPLMPVALLPAAAKLDTITDEQSIPVDMWREFLARTPAGGDARQLGALVVTASQRVPSGETPHRLPAVRQTGYDSVPPPQLLLASTDQEIRTLREEGLPFVVVTDESAVQALVERWGCQAASSMLRVDIVPEKPSEPIVLLDRFRRLRDYAHGELDEFELVGCSSLNRVVTMPKGTNSNPEDFAVSKRTIYFENSLGEDELLARISAHFSLGLDDRIVARILLEAENERVETAMAHARSLRRPAEKLLALLPSSTLEAQLPAGLLETVRTVSGNTDDRQIAELMWHVHGYNVLRELRHDLKDYGYPVPDTWAGSAPAIAFVRRLGFSAEFAGERGQQLDADITVLGPPNLPPLHDYQQRLAEQIRQLVHPSDAPGRALLFLPTGAGKTRVTVQALVDCINEEIFAGPVLWIAQSEELCEQAVQTWATVWRQFGNRPLRLCRLWDNNEVTASDSDANVVVATDAKLDHVRERADYGWLLDSAVVVIDEAHGATAPGITATLRWLGIAGRRTARPLLGLTATPFKGTGKEDNQSLASRFDHRQLNVLGEDPYGELQRLGVLARIRHRILQGSVYSLDDAERRRLTRYRDVPPSVLERVGRDQERTLRLLDDIATLPRDWPVLVFTSSVLAAQTLSALLRIRSVESATISGSTPTVERRRTIKAFHDGRIQVLTNCNVLTQGFDAPGIRALYIARPTFSPNAYIQMVGRALRGEANGGKAECLVVNVADTFDTFGEKLAYQEFDHLWRNQGGDPN